MEILLRKMQRRIYVMCSVIMISISRPYPVERKVAYRYKKTGFKSKLVESGSFDVY